MLTLLQYLLNVCNLILFVVLFFLKYIVLSFIFKSQGIELGEIATFFILAIVLSTSIFTCYKIYSFYSLRILVRKQVNDLLGDEPSINAKGSSLEGANLDTEKYNSQNVSNLDLERLSEVSRQLTKTFDAETVSRQYDLTELEMDAVLHLGQEEQLKIEIDSKIIAFFYRTDNNLDDLRDKWLLSYKAWQHVEMYDIGKAMEDYYAFKGNVYPVDTVRVKINIEKG